MSTVTAISERVDDLISEDVRLLKIDVEGFEPQAFASASGLVAHKKWVATHSWSSAACQ